MTPEIPKDTETLPEVEMRIALLYGALIRAELKAHAMRVALREAESCANS